MRIEAARRIVHWLLLMCFFVWGTTFVPVKGDAKQRTSAYVVEEAFPENEAASVWVLSSGDDGVDLIIFLRHSF